MANSAFLKGTTILSAGTNISITGTGSSATPYVINATGGGGGTIASTLLVLKGDNAGNAVAATVGTDYVTGASTNTFTNKSGNISQWTNDSAYITASSASTLTNKDLTSGTNTFPTFNQNTTGSAATLTTARTIAITGDLVYTSPSFNGSGNVTAAGTLATVNANVGSFGSATQVGTFAVNAKGLVTAAGNTTVTPAVGSITGLGTGVATALAVNVGSAGAPVVNGGALGTPSSGDLTSCTGKAVNSQIFDWNPYFLGTLANGDYKVVVNCSFAGTINEITTISTAGTGTLTGKINTTALGGTSNSVSTSEQTQAHASANTFAAGDDIVLTIASVSSLANMSVKIKYTRTLA